jgi:hypothetical protein
VTLSVRTLKEWPHSLILAPSDSATISIPILYKHTLDTDALKHERRLPDYWREKGNKGFAGHPVWYQASDFVNPEFYALRHLPLSK